MKNDYTIGLIIGVSVVISFCLGFLVKSAHDIENLTRNQLCTSAALVRLENIQAKELTGSPSYPVPYQVPEECLP